MKGYEELETEKTRTPEKPNVTTHSKKSRGSFFDSLFSKTKKIFEEGEEEFKD